MSSKSFVPPHFPGHFCVGWVKSAHGIRGEIYIHLKAKKADWLDGLQQIGLSALQSGELKLWDIEVLRPHKDGLIVKLKGVGDRNMSETLRKSSVFVDEKLLVSAPGESIFLKQILGFQLVDVDGKAIGEIAGFATNGAQDLLQVKLAATGVEGLVPFVEAFLRDIDFDKRVVTMDLPLGLFDS